jgi:hypothetical protein
MGASVDFQPLFDLICSHLGERSEYTARILLCAACELWAVAEAGACINLAGGRVLPPDFFVTTESKKRDLVVCTGTKATFRVHARIEAKLIYPNEAAKRVGALTKLRRQVEHPPRVDEVANVPRFGLVVAVWDSCFRCKRWQDADQFFSQAAADVTTVFPSPAYRVTDPEALRVVIAERLVRRGNVERSTALAATFVTYLAPVGVVTSTNKPAATIDE